MGRINAWPEPGRTSTGTYRCSSAKTFGEKAQREIVRFEAEADDAEEQRRFCRGMELRRGKHSSAHTERSPQHRRSTSSTASRPGGRARVLKQETTILSPDLQLVPNVVIKPSGWEVSGILREELGHALTAHARLSELPAKNSCRGSRLLALFRYARKQNTSVVRPLTCRS